MEVTTFIYKLQARCIIAEGRRNISNLGARHFEGTFFLRKTEPFSKKNKKSTSLFIEKNLGGGQDLCSEFSSAVA